MPYEREPNRSSRAPFALVAAALAALVAANATAQTNTLQDFAGSLAQPGAAVIYVAREFITMDPKQPRADAIAVKDGKFIAVGTRAEVEAAAGKGARLDQSFGDKVVIAGFIEQHVHPVLAALTMNTKVISIEDWDAVDGFSPAVRDEKNYQARLRAAIAAHKDPSKAFITWGYHHYFHGAMNRAMLDKLAPGFPVIVWHRSAHEFFLNSAALRLMKIDDALVKSFSKSAQEQLDLAKGHFFEQGGMAILPNITPHLASAEQFRNGLEFTKRYYHRNGITLACEPGGFLSKPLQDAINAVYSDDATPFNHCFIGDGKSFYAIQPNDPSAPAGRDPQGRELGQGPHLVPARPGQAVHRRRDLQPADADEGRLHGRPPRGVDHRPAGVRLHVPDLLGRRLPDPRPQQRRRRHGSTARRARESDEACPAEGSSHRAGSLWFRSARAGAAMDRTRWHRQRQPVLCDGPGWPLRQAWYRTRARCKHGAAG